MLSKKHAELLDAVNYGGGDDQDRAIALARLDGYRERLREQYGDCVGQIFIECDLYYLNKGIDRPMCCGIFLDDDKDDC